MEMSFLSDGSTNESTVLLTINLNPFLMIHSYFLSATDSDWPSLPQRSPQDLFQTSSKSSISWPIAQSTTKPILTTNWLTGLLFHHLALKPISSKQVQNQVSPNQLHKAPQTATLPCSTLNPLLSTTAIYKPQLTLKSIHPKPILITLLLQYSFEMSVLKNPASHKPHTTHSRAQP